MRGFFLLLLALGLVTGLSSLLWRRLATLAGRPPPRAVLAAQPAVGGLLAAVGIVGLIAAR